ncbi:hypothetical protein EVAR_19926_1 [Eumeta japonica]|uniref:Uncharacterized protein n=1 Tax=Eumeta variegata TaxID=151549 RepID=A0A4C1ZMJ7_EUMVA|nr:hypothetical protein EVAR_19926_1 [Eumeta japonica]
MRSLQLSLDSRTRAFTSRWRARAWICTREWDMLARQSCVFALINSRIRRKLPAIRGCRNLPLALLDHRPDVVGKSTYGKVNLVCRRDVIGNAIEVWSVDFSSAVDTLSN